jgi:hypothetical protein
LHELTTWYLQTDYVLPGYRKAVATYVPRPIKPGDPVFYRWGLSWGHASLVTRLSGKDPVSGWIGSLVNSHTTNRKWAIWHLKPYNQYWSKTQMAEFHINR